MELIFCLMTFVAAFLIFGMGYKRGIRVGASKTQSELLRGATLDLSDLQQNALAVELGHVGQETPSSLIRDLDTFVFRAFQMGRLVATANWQAGAAFQESSSLAAMERYNRT